ncbi:MAG: phosphoadenylyl-sulfate reductase [Oligoflexus sp.]
MSHPLLAKESWSPDEIEQLNESFVSSSAQEILQAGVAAIFPHITFANSFGLEDIVISHLLSQVTERVEIFVLDTGRLHPETYHLIEQWWRRFDLNLKILSPDATKLEPFVAASGPNAFYRSVSLRQRCCEIRKLEPLNRALQGKRAWITGLRRDQSQSRSETNAFALDVQGRLKINPLVSWTLDDVWEYVRSHRLPYNPLHDEGFPSIGCAPCTRAVAPGEDLRAGRWWWEQQGHKECGLHVRSKKEGNYASQSSR